MRAPVDSFRAGAPDAAALLVTALILILTLVIVSSPAPLRAQDGDPEMAPRWSRVLPTPFTQNAERPERAVDSTVRERILSPKCPKASFDYLVSFPQDMDRGGPVDSSLRALSQTYAAKISEGKAALERDAAECDPDFPDYAYTSVFHVTSSPYRVSASAFSVLFATGEYGGGGHGTYSYLSVNYLADGTLITLRRLFPDAAASLPRLWNSIYRGFCKNNQSLPSFYGEGACGGAIPPVPAPLKNPQAALDDAGHLLLTSLGLSVVLGGYDGYGFQGAFLDMPKSELLAMGADPAIWR
ncbi:MAG: hypothetical protein LBT40_06040 [Deltaproteobacteria bacterium]|jgi:hypothetical protein|nr:hypothetical protein [Deltaproteobacteria bacterium]